MTRSSRLQSENAKKQNLYEQDPCDTTQSPCNPMLKCNPVKPASAYSGDPQAYCDQNCNNDSPFCAICAGLGGICDGTVPITEPYCDCSASSEASTTATPEPTPSGGTVYQLDSKAGIVLKVVELSGGKRHMAVGAGLTADRDLAVNSRTTVAAAYCFAGMLAPDDPQPLKPSEGHKDAAAVGFGFYRRFVDPDGTTAEDIENSPNGMETNSLAVFNSLANVVGSCAIAAKEDENTCEKLYDLTGASTLLGALAAIVFAPDSQPMARGLYDLAMAVPQRYRPCLGDIVITNKVPTNIPPAWSLALVTNRISTMSPSRMTRFGGVGHVAFDKFHRAWFANNAVMGTLDSVQNAVVLNADGTPSSISPILGGGVLGGGYGAGGPDANGNMWLGNYGWGSVFPNQSMSAGISVFNAEGKPIYENGLRKGLQRVQGIRVDNNKNVWACSNNLNEIVVFINGDPDNKVSAATQDGPFDVGFDSQGAGYVSCAGDIYVSNNGTLQKFVLDVDKKTLTKVWEKPGEQMGHLHCNARGLTVTPDDHIFWACVGIDSVAEYDTEGNTVHNYAGVHWPWGLEADKYGRVWVGGFGLTGAGPPTYDTEGSQPALVLISPKEKGRSVREFYLPSGGSPLTFADGEAVVILGTSVDKAKKSVDITKSLSFHPLQKSTNARPDEFGNIWYLNNWKYEAWPSYSDPAGTSIVIFVGLGAVPQSK